MGCVTSSEDAKQRYHVNTSHGDVKYYGPSAPTNASQLVPLEWDVHNRSSGNRTTRRNPGMAQMSSSATSAPRRSTGSQSSAATPPLPATPGLVLTGVEGPGVGGMLQPSHAAENSNIHAGNNFANRVRKQGTSSSSHPSTNSEMVALS
mmetsp:Transcript_21326/g.41821  ORF Transcript_21326/g.41821 Transcript_21326/m.41821 type:complete len:149 (+) Transcript_21326:368-814(+)